MSAPEAWGYTLICFEDENTIFPMMFTEPVFSQEALAQFNRTVQQAAQTLEVEYNHEFTVKMVLMGLLYRLVPATYANAEDSDFDGIVIGAKLLSTITGLRYSTVRIAHSGTVVEQIARKTLTDAVKVGASIIRSVAGSRGVPTIYTVVETQESLDHIAPKF